MNDAKEDAMKDLIRTLAPRFLIAVLASLGFAVSCALAFGETSLEPEGSDVFITPRTALLREKPSPNGRILEKLSQGTRLTLVAPRDRYLKVKDASGCEGWIAREVAVLFAPTDTATREMVVVGRSFGGTDSSRTLAVCLLLRASERLRETKTPDPEVEVLLGETSEALAERSAGPYPQGTGIVAETTASGTHGRYDGSAFARAAAILGKDTSPEQARTRERAAAGLLRTKYPVRSGSYQTLLEETASWLDLVEKAEDPRVLASASERAGASGLALGRLLLALGKTEDIGKIRDRMFAAGKRVRDVTPDSVAGRRLVSRAAVLGSMRGNGTLSFPQEASLAGGSVQRVVRIDGKLGALQLSVETQAGATREVKAHKATVPILPVPGSLRISPDGRSVAWIEVLSASRLVPVMTSLERDEEAREVAFLSTGRPLRDRELAHVVSSLSGFSHDGQRLGMVIEAWNDTPGPSPRYSVVSVVTGELLFETSQDMQTYQRLLR
ncbi:MAG TPA: SH3 domain-containing protein [Thermoanaerobaculia bacterium]|nr:SH3 domain-containing protein [Thermoanaerobaculia bacterium]